jgi:crotonobetaine/carnitine-CoA ligase
LTPHGESAERNAEVPRENRGASLSPSALEQFHMHGQDIAWLLADRAAKRGDHLALIWAPRHGDGRQWTYVELNHDVRRVAAGLAGRGVRIGDHVLIHAENCPEMVLGWLACAVVGAVAVTTNTKSVAHEIGSFIERTGCVGAITQPRYAAVVAGASDLLQWVVVTEDNSGEPAMAAEADHGLAAYSSLYGDAASWPGRPVDPMLPFCIMFTSGTTSSPKAVVHTHANAIWASRTGPRNIDLKGDDRYLIYLPFFHVNAQSWSFFPALGVGATVVLTPKWSTSQFWPVVQRHEVTHMSLMPFSMAPLMDPGRPSTTLRAGVFGAIIPTGPQMFGLDVYSAYGMTETVTHAVTGKPTEDLAPGSIGRAAPGYEVAVVDKETGELCLDGRPGELWIKGTRGIQIFLEYFGNPEATADSFHDGWFKTGDVVRTVEGGVVVYVERDKDVLKVGGENVSAREVEDVIVAQAAVSKVAVVGKQHDFLNEVPVAFVVKADQQIDDAELEKALIEVCAGRLASFKVPRAVYVVDEFPLGTLDKILKNRLREMADEHPPV